MLPAIKRLRTALFTQHTTATLRVIALWPRTLILTASALLAFAGSASGSETTSKRPEFQFTRIGPADGLSQTDVRAIVQDPQGFMWFGTWLDGIARYDGYGFRAYRHSERDSRSLTFDSTFRLLVDRRGDLWVGTFGGGLERYDRDADSFIHFRHDASDAESLPDDIVRALHEDNDGGLWVGGGPAVSRFDRERGKFVTFHPKPGDPVRPGDNSVRAICRDRNTGLVWLGSRTGVRLLDPQTGHHTPLEARNAPASAAGRRPTYSIIQDHAGDIWVGTDGSLERWDPRTLTCTDHPYNPANPDGLSSSFITALHEDRHRRLWIGTIDGLNLFDRTAGRFFHYRHDPAIPTSLSDGNISTDGIYEDAVGNLWIATAAGGVNLLPAQSAKFVTFRHRPENDHSLSQNSVTALYADRAGRLWIGTAQGLNCHQDDTFTRFVSNPADESALPPNPIWAVNETEDGRLWIATAGGGLCSFDGRSFTRYRPDPKDPRALAYHTIYSILPDPRGGLWLAMHGKGLDYFDGAQFHHFPPRADDPDSLADAYVGTLVWGNDGGLWMGSASMGLLRFDPVTHRASRHLIDPSRPGNKVGNWVRDICTDGDTIWVASYSGLHRFEIGSGRFTASYTQHEGLASSSVLSVALDARGDVWAGTVSGLSQLDPRTGGIRNYDTSDGLQSAPFCERARARLPDGRMCFGGTNGFSIVKPGNVSINRTPPPVVLTDFELFNQAVSSGPDTPLAKAIHAADHVTLRHDQNVFRLRFAALDYTAPHKNRYAYKLEGFDKDWRFASARDRSATYTRLAAGRYTFRVRASNNDGVWNEQGTSLAITITPPWWLTWWWRTGAILGAVALTFGSYRWRIHQVRRRERLLEKVVAERTSELQAKRDELQRNQEALLEAVNELQANRKQLESANKELESFSYSVSHDLRAPLRSIDGFSQALLEDFGADLHPEARGYLATIRRAAGRMAQLIEDMLRLARLNRSSMRWESVDLTALVTELAETLRATEPSREAEFVIAEGCVAEGDPNLLRIALENILGNAWKYTGRKPRTKIEFGFTRDDWGTTWFVRDNGCGFDMRYASKLFGIFQRLHGIEEYPGTGVGLATVQRIIARHGGTVSIYGEVDKGTTLSFTLGHRPAV